MNFREKIEKSGFSQESFGLKRDWLELSKLFLESITRLKSSSSKVFKNTQKRNWSIVINNLPITSLTNICFISFRYLEIICINAVLEIIDRDLTIDLLHDLIIWNDASSYPCALVTLRTLIIFNTSSSLKKMRKA